MYIIGMICIVIVSLLYVIINESYFPFIGSLIFFIAPGFYYFYRNKHELKDAILISALFGFTMIPAYVLFNFLTGMLRIKEYLFYQVTISQQLNEINFVNLFLNLFLSGIVYSASTITSWILVNQYKQKVFKRGKDK